MVTAEVGTTIETAQAQGDLVHEIQMMTDEVEPTFEEALAQLERIVAELERGGPNLTSALGRYESGIRLVKRCHLLLDQAEQSVALLTGVDADGNPITSPFDAAATVARETVSSTVTSSSTVVIVATEPTVEATTEFPETPAPRTPARKTARRVKDPAPSFDPDSFDPPF